MAHSGVAIVALRVRTVYFWHMTSSVPVSDLTTLIAAMSPRLNSGVFAFISVAGERKPAWEDVVAAIREPEGLSLVVPLEVAEQLGAAVLFRAAWITLTVHHSDLQAVGLTAAFSRALADVGISCNVVAGAYHDHIFVPHEQASAAMAVLVSLQQAAAHDRPG
jgi:hypothetical protein